jgi:hypothetical protein
MHWIQVCHAYKHHDRSTKTVREGGGWGGGWAGGWAAVVAVAVVVGGRVGGRVGGWVGGGGGGRVRRLLPPVAYKTAAATVRLRGFAYPLNAGRLKTTTGKADGKARQDGDVLRKMQQAKATARQLARQGRMTSSPPRNTRKLSATSACAPTVVAGHSPPPPESAPRGGHHPPPPLLGHPGVPLGAPRA